MIKGTKGVNVKGGICADCRFRNEHGATGEVKHLYCNFTNSYVKNPKKKSCPHYEQASPELLKHFQKVMGYGGIGKRRKHCDGQGGR